MRNSKVILTLAVALLGAANPVIAKSNTAKGHCRRPADQPRPRAEALRECSALEASFNGICGKQYRRGVRAVTPYRSCMARDGNVE